MTPSTLDIAETLAAHEFDIPCVSDDGAAQYVIDARKSCGCASVVFGCEHHTAQAITDYLLQRRVQSLHCGHFCTLDEIRVEPIRGGA